ncbi:unnamed protein product, partial [marine sediment metagenome]
FINTGALPDILDVILNQMAMFSLVMWQAII